MMQWSLIILCSSVVVTLAQDYGNSYHGYDDDKKPGYQPPSHSANKQSGSYPGAYPNGYQHQKRPGYGGYSPGYGPPNPYGGGPYAQYSYNQWKHYGYCKPDYTTYPENQGHHLRYLDSADEGQLNTNTSNFQPPPPVRGPISPNCEQGPKYVLHSEQYEWHYPPIYKGVCDKLPGCKDPKCISTKTVKTSACVLVFRHYGYRWVKVGYRKITFKSDLSCKCRQCKDIKSYRECVHEHPCPNEGGPYSYCFWKKPKTRYDDHEKTKTSYDNKPKQRDQRDIDDEENDEEAVSRSTRSTYDYDRYDHYGDDKKGYGYDRDDKKGYGYDKDDKRGYGYDPYDPYKHPLYPVPAGSCDCCTPKLCKPPRKFDYDICDCVCPKKKCLPGHKFNPETCKCECPKGTYFDKTKQKCVGKCKELTAKACEHVLCKDNPHFYCKRDKDYSCRCPSCQDVDYWQGDLCKKTNCIEQGYKPYCVFDWRNGQCRCPECEDQKTPQACEKTSCLDPYKAKKQCKWVWYPYPSCQCNPRKYSPPQSKKSDYNSRPSYGNDKKTPPYRG